MKWLAFRSDTHKTPAIVRAAELMDPYFEGIPSDITSGLRTPLEQLALILQKAKKHNIEEEFYEVAQCMGSPIAAKINIDGLGDVYWWQRVWSRLLSIGDIINPPIPAAVLSDYFRPGSENNKKGQIIEISNHMRGLAFDIGGGHNLLEKAKRVMKAYQSGECFIRSYLVEGINNAVHVDVIQIG